MSEKYLVIVESPTKAKTIRKFLPKNYMVEASMGHIRDLPQSAADIPKDLKKEDWAKLGVNVEDDFKPLYIVPKGKSKIVRELKKKLKEATELFLATDEDREGESISFHLLELLKPKVPVKRMVFHEITKKAIQQALENTREVDIKLVQAQEARRILDRLYGYTLSPLLWKKIAYGLSAGRVQSTGIKLISEREKERMRFVSNEYWDIKVDLQKAKSQFQAKLIGLDGKRLATGKDFDGETGELKDQKKLILESKRAKELASKLATSDLEVVSVEEKASTARPSIPFITSTLQQEGNRKLGLSARQTMRTAQKLYEEGLITYMRTDSPTLSGQAIAAAREEVEKLYGKDFLSPSPRQFAAKNKQAQEAHEAIRPAGETFVHPKNTGLTGKDRDLYELIWKRTLACQMADAKKSTMTVKFDCDGAEFVSTGTRIVFPGFLRVYVEGKDDPDAALDDKEVILPKLDESEKLPVKSAHPLEHHTKPPARFTEASLVQRLEKEGIGRPSTYASILGTIQERGYVRKNGNQLVPTFTGMAVVQLLESHFSDLVNYNFTGDMEGALDEIATGDRAYLEFLSGFYKGKKGLKAKVDEREKSIKPDESRSVKLPQMGEIPIKVGRYGPYVVVKGEDKEELHASIPEDVAPADLKEDDVAQLIEMQKRGPEPIGIHPDTKENIYCLVGRYGAYLQLGEKTEEQPKPKRAKLPSGLTPQTVDLETAVKLLLLPRELGEHPERKLPVVANLGRFGPYVMCDGDFRSLKKDDDLYTVDLARALELLAEEKKGRGGRSKAVKELGNHSKKKKKIALYDGQYGPYLKFGTKNIGLPDELKDLEKAKNLTLEEAEKIVDGASKK